MNTDNPEIKSTAAWAIAVDLMKQRFVATHKDHNAINQRLAEEGYLHHCAISNNDTHIADLIANENLKTTTEIKICRRILRLEHSQQRTLQRRMDRINKGRTCGAGAGGYNRDLDRINHSIDIDQHELIRLKQELELRISNLTHPTSA